MHIGLAGQVSLEPLQDLVRGKTLPPTYSFPLIGHIARELLGRGHRVSVFALSDGVAFPRRFNCGELTIHIGRYRPRSRDRALDMFATERTDLLEAIRRDNCDMVHAHWTYEFALAALESGKPCLVTAHDAPWEILRIGWIDLCSLQRPLAQAKALAYLLVRLLMATQVSAQAKAVTCVSPYLQDHWVSRMGLPFTPDLIPNGVPPDLLELRAPRHSKLARVTTFATILSDWGPRKNGRSAIRAFDCLRRRFPGSRLLMFGFGYGPGEAASEWAARQGMVDSIEFVGQVPHNLLMERLSSDVDVLVHPALEESFGMTVCEAMALGVPVVAGRSAGAIPWVVRDGLSGLLVDVTDTSSICEAMLLLATDPAKRREMGQAAREDVRARFRLPTVVDGYVAAYHRLLGR